MKEEVTVNGKDFSVYLTKEEIIGRVWDLGQQITNDYRGKTPIILSVLNGAFIFTADLVRHIELPLNIEFVRLSSYEGTSSTGKLTEVLGLKTDLENQDVIIVEDIVDTGFTLSNFVKTVKSKNPNSVKIVSLLRKPEAISFPVEIDYVGFDIPNDFVLGYGLDYDEVGRELPQIYKLVE
ncbi:MAG: hypoxanthine phosphoribosyltransferase [Saprospiraceae bacterium]|nr:hypoxanthine phosphoribosyltransferase [Saprospiraceae bacterium]|tara:strand:+ start:3551 stop:4090 length:540 start_codon:yes stop_codon:yes gene_type:complete